MLHTDGATQLVGDEELVEGAQALCDMEYGDLLARAEALQRKVQELVEEGEAATHERSIMHRSCNIMHCMVFSVD